MSKCTTTSKPSQLSLFAATDALQSTSLPAVFPARTPRPRTPKAKALTGLAQDCSSKPCGSCASCDPVGFSLRTSLVSDLAALTGYSLNWKRQATPSGRWWWVLGTPERRTGGIGSGLLPTPTAAEAERTSATFAGGNPTLRGALMPTPRPCSGLRSRGVNQTEIQRALLPTPANQSQRGGVRMEGGAGGRKKLQEMGLLATPTKRDWKSGKASEATHARNSRPLSEQSYRGGGIGTAALLILVEWMMGYPKAWLGPPWPPTAIPSARKSSKRSGVRS